MNTLVFSFLSEIQEFIDDLEEDQRRRLLVLVLTMQGGCLRMTIQKQHLLTRLMTPSIGVYAITA